jgi:N-acyl-D-aspartate/D-glutamate deacylase
MTYDAIIFGGKVCSGELEPALQADVAIEGGRIAAVGHLSGDARTVIDATGHVVSPGFIDIHSHSDYTLLADPRALSAVHQGVTLEVVGNCGFGCAPIGNPAAAREGIYGFDGSVPLMWRDFTGYFAALQSAQPAVNVMSLVPNGQLRRAALDDLDAPAGRAALEEMAKLLEQGLLDGCCGYSTGLEYPVERGASEEELGVLVKRAAECGAFYATHTRARGVGALPAIEEAIRTARQARARLQISHIIPRRTEDGEIERSFDLVAKARAEDVEVAFDMHTRAFGTTMLNTLLPPWVTKGSWERRDQFLSDGTARERMREYPSIIPSVEDWARVVLLDMPAWPEYGRLSLAEVAERRGQDPLDTAYDLLRGEPRDGPPFMVILLCYSPEQQAAFFSHPDCIPASDATTLAPDGPLARSMFHGAYTWAAWFYRFMVREKRLLSPEEAVHRMSGLPASVLGLKRRGRLKVGMAADVAVFDPAGFSERGTVFEPNALATGMRDLFVNGIATLREGSATGERAGRVVRSLDG